MLPSGNSRLSRLHTKISLSPRGQKGDVRKLQFRVLPDDRTCSYLEIWLPTRDETWTDDGWMELTLTPPAGRKVAASSSWNKEACDRVGIKGRCSLQGILRIYRPPHEQGKVHHCLAAHGLAQFCATTCALRHVDDWIQESAG